MNITDQEIWKPVVGYEGFYEVSNMGNLRSLDRYRITKLGKNSFLKGAVISPNKNSQGYCRVRLCRGSRVRKLVHRIVAESFIGPSLLPIDHINGDPTDNRLQNLQYVSFQENSRRGRTQTRVSLYVPIYKGKRGIRYRVVIPINKKAVHKGSFETLDEAIKQRDKIMAELNMELYSGVKNR